MTAALPARGHEERRELRALTSLRGIAALAVVATHFSATAQGLTASPIPSLVPHGYMAVDFFFVLSGFIMSYTYLRSFLDRREGAYADFLMRRVARIIPLHVSVILIIALLGVASVVLSGANLFFDSTAPGTDLLANLLLLPGLGIGPAFNGPAWSISTEMVAYFSFPVLVWAVFRHGRLGAWIAALIAVAGLTLLAMGQKRLGLAYDGMPWNLVRCICEFSLGMLAYRIHANSAWRSVLGTDFSTLGLSAACVASLVLRCDLPAALLFPFLVVAFAANQGRAARPLEAGVPYFLGVVSYSIYLVHNPLRTLAIMLAQRIIGTDVSPAVALAFAAAATLCVVPFAWVAYSLIEKPGRTIVRQSFAAAQRRPSRAQP